MELNITGHDKRQKVACYGPAEDPFVALTKNVEEPGTYFHPLLATLITGAARLMLAIAERLAEDAGLTWAFCDTDSMALAQPDGISEAEFIRRAQKVREWFTPLNPYKKKEPLFKIENFNYRVKKGEVTTELEPLYCWAVSAKRYALFNIARNGKPVLRKASGHGLGHLLPPYEAKDAPAIIPKPVVALEIIGVERWEYDLWYLIVQAALSDNPTQVRLELLPGFEQKAVSSYSAATPNLLGWFGKHNGGKTYRDQVKPFNFLLAFQSQPVLFIEITAENHKGQIREPRPVAPYDKDYTQALSRCFDRNTGLPVSPERLKTYREQLNQYHLHPEDKFHNGDYTDSGFTSRRHIEATIIEHIGKEANRWEEQFYLGGDAEAQIIYGLTPDDLSSFRDNVLLECEQFSQRKLAQASGLSLSQVWRILTRQGKPSLESIMRLHAAIKTLLEANQRPTSSEL